MPDLRYLTRDELREELRARGFPIGKTTFDKLCAPSVGQGPPVEAYWPGRRNDRPLYTLANGLAWAESRLLKSPKQQSL